MWQCDLSGASANRYDYTAWGEPYEPRTRTTLAQRYAFTGREYNPAGSIIYYRYRQYDPTAGRFMSRDPAGYRDGAMLYAYVSQQPAQLIDPFGMQEQCCCCCVTSITLDNIRRTSRRERKYAFGQFIREDLVLGHHFEVHIGLQYKRWEHPLADCTFKWNEMGNLIPRYLRDKGAVSDQWCDVYWMFKDDRQCDKPLTIAPWDARSKPCPGFETVNLYDEPEWPLSPGLPLDRYLKFQIVVSSAPGCDCPVRTLIVEAEQRLKSGNTATGIADDGWEFTHGTPYQMLLRAGASVDAALHGEAIPFLVDPNHPYPWWAPMPR